MGPICWSFYSGNRGTEGVEFIRYIDGRDPQMHKIWCLGSNGITCEVHLTAQIDVIAETVRQFATQYFAENGRRISIIDQISVKRSIKRLGIPADSWGCGLPFFDNVLALTITHGCGGNDTSNRN